ELRGERFGLISRPFSAWEICGPEGAEHLFDIRVRDLPLIEHLHRGFPSAMTRAMADASGRGVRCGAHTLMPSDFRSRSFLCSVAISTAAMAASQPLLAGPATARSNASSTEFVVSTPKVIGTPVAAAAS